MARLSPRNLAWIRQNHPEIAEALGDIRDSVNNVASQVNAEPVGVTAPPQAHNDLKVVGGNGKFAVTITHNQDTATRGLTHSVEYAVAGTSFSNPQPVHLGPNKTATLAIGSGPYEFRSAAQYPTSAQSQYKYLAGAVSAGGATDPPMPVSQGVGYGNQPYTTVTPPKKS